jgi:glutamate-1-semialdehyde 2,1-aminomutase
MRIILPEPGYLEAVRELTSRYGIVLIFDEVKTGLCVAPGGATEWSGVTPDLVTLAKSLGGGLPMGAVGGSAEVMSVVKGGSVYQVGTYSGNPLCVAAAKANLLEVLTPQAYTQLNALNDALIRGCNKVADNFSVAAYSLGLGAKGCVTFAAGPVTDYETFQANRDSALSELVWLYFFNRGIYCTPNLDQEWTLSVTHPEQAVRDYISVFEELLGELVPS